MKNQKLEQKLSDLEARAADWFNQLEKYYNWAMQNDWIIGEEEQANFQAKSDQLNALLTGIEAFRSNHETDAPMPQQGKGEVPTHFSDRLTAIEQGLEEIKQLLAEYSH